MKVFLFIDSLGSGGAQRQLSGLAVLLQNNGYDVVVCSYHKYDFYKEYLEENNVTNYIISGAAKKYRRILSVYKFFKSKDPDWVIAFQETPSLLACISKLMGCRFKLIVSERNTTQRVGWNELIRFHLYHVANYIVPNSFTQFNYLNQHYSWMKKKLRTICNYVDLDRFHPVSHSKSQIAEIIVVASLWESKNPSGLLDVCKLLKDQQAKVHITWFGINDIVTEAQQKLLRSVREMNLSDFIVFLPKTKSIEDEYHKADFLCLPSFYEGTPNVICEAIASGLPIICSDVCDNGLYVIEGKNGFLFNPKDPINMAESFQKALRLTNEEYQNYRLYSRKIAESKLSKESFLVKYERLLKS